MDEGSDESAVPTEFAGLAEADTQSAYAWGLADDSPEVEPVSDRPFWVTTAAIAASAGLVTIASVLAYLHLGRESAPVAVSAPLVSTTVPLKPVARPVPPPPPVTVTTVVVESKVAAPPPPRARPAPVMSRWSYDVRWGGVYGITVIEHAGGSSQTRYVTGGENLGMGTGWTGDVIGADPVIDPSIGWAECTLYIDGVVAKKDYAASGDGHDVSCLMRLTQ